MGTSLLKGVPDYTDMKAYFKPTTVSVEIEAKWVLCQAAGSPNNNNVSGDPDPLGGASRRQVF